MALLVTSTVMPPNVVRKSKLKLSPGSLKTPLLIGHVSVVPLMFGGGTALPTT